MSGGVITTAVRHLLAAGVTGDALLAAIADMESAFASPKDDAAERRRARDRDYQREKRRQISADSADSADSGDLKKSPPDPQKKNPPLNGSPKGEPIPPKPKAGRSVEFEVPDWIPAEPWAAFAAMRKRKGKPLDDYTAKQLFGRLRTIRDAGWNIEDVINKAAIGNHDGFWMPDGRDSNVRRVNSGSSGRPMNVQELRNAIRFAEDHDDPERAAELKRQLAQRSTGPPADPAVASLVHSAAQSLRH